MHCVGAVQSTQQGACNQGTLNAALCMSPHPKHPDAAIEKACLGGHRQHHARETQPVNFCEFIGKCCLYSICDRILCIRALQHKQCCQSALTIPAYDIYLKQTACTECCKAAPLIASHERASLYPNVQHSSAMPHSLRCHRPHCRQRVQRLQNPGEAALRESQYPIQLRRRVSHIVYNAVCAACRIHMKPLRKLHRPSQ